MSDRFQRVYKMSVASVYPMYIEKAEKKGRTKEEVDEIFRWLTGHSQESLEKELADKTTSPTPSTTPRASTLPANSSPAPSAASGWRKSRSR